MIYYRELSLDRAGEKRGNRDWLRQQWADPASRVLILREDKSLMRWIRESADSPEVITLPATDVAALVEDFEQLVFLGRDDCGAIFALDVSHHATERIAPLVGDNDFIDLRACGWLLDAEQASRLAYARGLVYWNRHHRFCGTCGSPTQSRSGGHVRRCSNDSCGRSHFPRTDPAVIMLVEDLSDPAHPRCLLARNSRFPARMMSTLAGFVDPLESLEETVIREVYEECGIRVGGVRYQASQPWPFPSSIMLGFRAEALTTEIEIDGVEIEEAYWFEPGEVAGFGEWGDGGDNFCLPRRDSIARYLVNCWVEEKLE